MYQIVKVTDFIRTFKSTRGDDHDNGLAYLHMQGDLGSMLGVEPYPGEAFDEADSLARETLREYENGAKPKSVKAIEALANVGMSFPIYYDHPMAVELFTLYSLALLSGRIDKHFYPCLHVRPDMISTLDERIGEIILKSVDGLYTPIPAPNAFGRLLFLMGVPIGKFTDAQLDLHNIDYISENGLIDLSSAVINQWIQNKFKPENSQYGGAVLSLRAKRNSQDADVFADTFIDLLYSVFPELGFRKYIQTRKYASSKGTLRSYTPEIHITCSAFDQMMESDMIHPETKELVYPTSLQP